MIRRILAASLVILTAVAFLSAQQQPPPVKLLFLGDPTGHHKPAERFRQLQPIMAARGIDITYTDKTDSLNAKLLAGYDGLIVYANIDRISAEQEKALLDFVAEGKGFIPLHCASYCFRNSDKYVELVGAQFLKHGTGTVRTTIAEPNHPIMKGFQGFESFDETYVHTKHNEKDRIVLEYRPEKDGKEPWTWIRTHGKGRVFYTAWGHDDRTWSKAGFHDLVERGIRWAVRKEAPIAAPFNDKPEMTSLPKDLKPFNYMDADVPFYPPGGGGAKPGNRLKKMQLPAEAEESMKHYVHPAGFELKLFADEKQFGGKPICMNWDERGRLWVAVTIDYPNELQPTGRGRDKILILEDTDNDGKADKVITFADKLSIPTSLVFAHGGAIVHQAPHTLFLRDTNGDDVSDERQVLFSGWHTGDTHAGPSNLRYGLDNWYYGIVGYSGFTGTVAGERHSFRQGFYRFKVEKDKKSGEVKVAKLEFLRGTSNNSWGVGFSEEGLLFGSTANGCASVYLPIPNRYYERVRGWSSSVLPNIAESNRIHPITKNIRQVDFHNGFTAAAGHALYTARTYPREYWNRAAFVSEPTGHLTATFLLQPNGTDFRTRHGWNLVAADDEWASPIMAEVGPDGCVWVIDWYAFIVQHNPTPPGFKTGKGNAYETELRDKKHGRVYRLVPKDAKLPAPLDLKAMKGDDLVNVLKNDNMLWRLHAQRLLAEGKGIPFDTVKLYALIKDPALDGVGLNVGAVHAMWTIQGMNLITGPGASSVAEIHYPGFEHRSRGVRRNAAQVMALMPVAYSADIYLPLLKDTDPHVRLSALLGMADISDPGKDAAKPLVDALLRSENLSDRWLPDGLTIAAARHDLVFLREVAARKELPSRAATIVTVVAEHYARTGPTKTVASLLPSLSTAEPAVAEAIIAGLSKGWPRGQTADLQQESEKALAQLLPRLSPGGRGQMLKLADVWGSKGLAKQSDEVIKSLLAVISDEKQKDEQRIDAAKQLVGFRTEDAAIVQKLVASISPRTSPQVAAAFIDVLGASTSAEVGPALLKQFEGWPPTVRAAALRVLLGRPESTRELLDALEKGQVQLGEMTLDQKQALASHPDGKIAQRAKKLLERGGGLPSADRQKVLEDMLALTKKTGDVTMGQAMFKKHCANCHTHSGEGNKIGPDLTGTAVHTREHLLTDILDPSRNVEGNYRVYTIALRDGRTMTGLLASETKTAIEVIDAQAKKHVILREDLEQLAASGKSLMPDGFEKLMTPEEVVHLLEFLTLRGKYLPLSLERVATIVSTKGMFFKEESTTERMIFPDWKPKEFEGVPFHLVDPQGDRVPNVILLNGPNGTQAPKMPKSVTLPCNSPAKAIHFLSGVSGWGFPYGEKGSVSMIVRLHYEDGKTEDHALKNGEHFADYIRRVDVPESKFAFALRNQQIRYLAIQPQRADTISKIELIKGSDASAPIVMAVTVETR